MTLPLMSKKKYVSVLSFFKNNADITDNVCLDYGELMTADVWAD